MASVQKKICPSCNAKNRLNAKKCYNCGHSLNTSFGCFSIVIVIGIIVLFLIKEYMLN